MRRSAARGQALVEMGITVVLLVTLVMGIIEFGRAFMIANMIVHAAREGARIAAVVPATQRSASGMILDPTPIQRQVLAELKQVMDVSAIRGVSVVQGTAGGIPTVTVSVNGRLPLVFALPGVGTSVAIARSATFRDEGR
jgi:Flp pilus assembly protein TadG